VIASQTDPSLTSIHQPIDEMGRAMAQLLYDRIRGIESPPFIILDTHLVRRQSA
jgi:DNA-binding LacI/PurR family transcriptional regulator